ncbi:MAG: UMP kinase [Kiritimatiellia bacterium]
MLKGAAGQLDTEIRYKRILLKLSGEVLGNRDAGECIDPDILAVMAGRVADIVEMGVQIGIVLGGGNIFRGLKGQSKGVDRTTGDYMGMLATIINGLAMQNALEQIGLDTRVQTAIEMREVAEPFIKRKAVRHLEKGRVVIFAGGTGSPFFSTDTAAALRASEIGADVVLKATKVDGVYTSNPRFNPEATRLNSISYEDALTKRYEVMDSAAFALCMENDIPIVVFDFFDEEALERIVRGETEVGTFVGNQS